jgi:hypothetical protein
MCSRDFQVIHLYLKCIFVFVSFFSLFSANAQPIETECSKDSKYTHFMIQELNKKILCGTASSFDECSNLKGLGPSGKAAMLSGIIGSIAGNMGLNGEGAAALNGDLAKRYQGEVTNLKRYSQEKLEQIDLLQKRIADLPEATKEIMSHLQNPKDVELLKKVVRLNEKVTSLSVAPKGETSAEVLQWEESLARAYEQLAEAKTKVPYQVSHSYERLKDLPDAEHVQKASRALRQVKAAVQDLQVALKSSDDQQKVAYAYRSLRAKMSGLGLAPRQYGFEIYDTGFMPETTAVMDETLLASYRKQLDVWDAFERSILAQREGDAVRRAMIYSPLDLVDESMRASFGGVFSRSIGDEIFSLRSLRIGARDSIFLSVFIARDPVRICEPDEGYIDRAGEDCKTLESLGPAFNSFLLNKKFEEQMNILSVNPKLCDYLHTVYTKEMRPDLQKVSCQDGGSFAASLNKGKVEVKAEGRKLISITDSNFTTTANYGGTFLFSPEGEPQSVCLHTLIHDSSFCDKRLFLESTSDGKLVVNNPKVLSSLNGVSEDVSRVATHISSFYNEVSEAMACCSAEDGPQAPNHERCREYGISVTPHKSAPAHTIQK